MPKQRRTRLYSFQPRAAASVRASRRGALALLAGTLMSQGCYMYRATSVPALEPDEEVRVTLSEQASRVALPGAPDARRVEGRFADATTDSLRISVWIGAAYRGTPFESTYQHLALPRTEVLVVEDRQLSKSRTGLLLAGVAAIIVTMIDQLGVYPIFTGDGSDGLPVPPEPEGAIFRQGAIFRR